MSQCMKRRSLHHSRFAIFFLSLVIAPTLLATAFDTADHSMRQFLEQDDTQTFPIEPFVGSRLRAAAGVGG